MPRARFRARTPVLVISPAPPHTPAGECAPRLWSRGRRPSAERRNFSLGPLVFRPSPESSPDQDPSMLFCHRDHRPREPVGSSREAVELIRRAQHGVLSQCRKFMQPFRAPGEDLSSKTCTNRSAIAGKEQYRPSNSTETTTTAANGEAPRLPCPGARPRRRR